jgi:hypothetical protein
MVCKTLQNDAVGGNRAMRPRAEFVGIETPSVRFPDASEDVTTRG